MHSTPSLRRRAAAELLGTFALVFAGCSAVIVTANGAGLGLFGVSAVFGLVVTAIIYASGHLSGAHLNPAVTAALVIGRHFPAKEAGAYVAAQLGGAVLASFALLGLWSDQPAELGATTATEGVGTALVYEIVLTAILMFVITAVATDTRAVGTSAAIAVGATVALCIMVGGPVSGGSLNPARSFGPALASGTWTDFWIYLVGPFVGAVLGAVAYRFVRDEAVAAPA